MVFLLQQGAGVTLNFPAGIQTGTLTEMLLQQASYTGSVYAAELQLPPVNRSHCYSDSVGCFSYLTDLGLLHS